MLKNAAVLLEDFVSEGMCLAFAWTFRIIIKRIYTPSEVMLVILLHVDDAMVLGVIVWLVYQLGVKLWNQRERIDPPNGVVDK
jgi:hypothetical protein